MEVLKVIRQEGTLIFTFNTGEEFIQNVAIPPEAIEYENEYDQVFWDSLCNGCGLCCYYRYENDDLETISTDLHCIHFNSETKKCNTFETRTQAIEGCNRLSPSNMPSGLPDTCSYVKFLKGRLKNG